MFIRQEIFCNRLIYAARTNDVTTLTSIMLQQGESAAVVVNTVNEYGHTALIMAAANGHVAAVQALLAVPGIIVDAVNQYGHTALIRAAANGHTAVVQALLAVPGINVDAADQSGYTALICAAANGHTAVVQALLAVPGINVDAADQSGYTALICAAANGHIAVVQALLAVPGINVNAVGQLGYTALIMAAASGDIAAVRALLAVPGINLDAQNYLDHRTAAAEAERRISNRPAYRVIYDLIMAAIRARRLSGVAVTAALTSNDESMPDAEKLRTARLKIFGRALSASNTALSFAAQPAGQNDDMAIDPRP